MRKLSRRAVIKQNEYVLELNCKLITFNSSKCGSYMFTQTWEGPFSYEEVNDEFLWNIDNYVRGYWKDLVAEGYKRIK